MEIKSAVIFGGAGLVGMQIARRICREFRPQKLVVCALYQQEAIQAVDKLKAEFPEINEITYEYGNIFVREQFSQLDRKEIMATSEKMNQIFDDVYGEINDNPQNMAQNNFMGQIIQKHTPEVVVDCINTATGISYQDVKSSSTVVKEFKDGIVNSLQTISMDDFGKAQKGDQKSQEKVIDFAKEMYQHHTAQLDAFPGINNIKMIELMLASQSVPQLVRHVILLQRALIKAKTRMYIKVGTTGTGGMGINIPYTHGEDRPSFTLMAKTAVGFAHTGLMFLLARTPGPIIKEIKPGAMIGYRRIDFRPVSKFRNPVSKWESQQEILEDKLYLRKSPDGFKNNGPLKFVGIDTGENGFFSRGEFEAITYLNQMEFITPEEIARTVIFEINGGNTGNDVIAAIDGAVMNPSYRAGYIRQDALDKMSTWEDEKGIPSVAIGELGPPQLSKFLYEAHLLHHFYKSIKDLASKDSVATMSAKLEKYVLDNEIKDIITSLGIAILLSDGKAILRGPTLNIPESKVCNEVNVNMMDSDLWAKRGWVDLRISNMQIWKERAEKMLSSQDQINTEGSAGFHHRAYNSKDVKIGEMVGWIFINEFDGRRVI